MKNHILLIAILLALLLCLPALHAQDVYDDEEVPVELLVQDEQEALEDLYSEIGHLRELATRKKELRTASENGNNNAVRAAFISDRQTLQTFLDEGDYAGALNKYIDLAMIYQGFGFLDDQLLYFEGVIYYGYGRKVRAQSIFERMVGKYPDSIYFAEAIGYLEDLYIHSGMDEEFLAVAARNPNQDAPKHIYWMGQANYNVGNLENAENMFTTLTDDPEYGFRSKCMLSMIGYYNFGLEYAIESFLNLMIDNQPDTPYFDFVYLSLARLYQERQDYDKAQYCYDQYLAITERPMTDELRYEMVVLFLKVGDFETANQYLREIVDNSTSAAYFTSASYLLTIVNMEMGNLDEARENINEALATTSQILEAINIKNELMNRHQSLMNQYKNAVSSEMKTNLLNQMRRVNEQIIATSNVLENLSVGLTEEDYLRLQIYEEELAYYNETFERINLLTKIANTKSNKKVPKRIDDKVEILDEYAIRINTLQLLSNMQQLNPGEYEMAYVIASETYDSQKTLDKWREIKQEAQAKGMMDVVDKANRAIQLLEENISSLATVSMYTFGELRTNTDIQQELAAEIENIDRLKNEFQDIREQTVREYNKKLAVRLKRLDNLLVEENSSMKQRYENFLTSLEAGVEDTSAKYRYTLVDILYRESMLLDQEYRDKQAEYKQSLNNSGE